MLLVCATFPLIWVGGLVTTYDAGMAVPDWPGTFGYNLFLYPWQTWILGPWDLFIEHGHRLLGALVGMITIALVIAVWRCEERRWMRWVAVSALVLVIFQGVLGGMRVLLNERQLALLHGCTGPAFFAFTVAIAVLTSRCWIDRPQVKPHSGAATIQRIALLTVLFSYIQLVIGAHLRHIPVSASPGTFRVIVFFHLLMAAVITAHVILLTVQTWIVDSGNYALLKTALVLIALVFFQLVLGAGTWVVSFSWPTWMSESAIASGYTIQSRGWVESNIVTAHVATGSLIVATAVQLALRSLRLLHNGEPVASVPLGMKGAIA